MSPRDCLHIFPDMSCAYCRWQLAKARVEELEKRDRHRRSCAMTIDCPKCQGATSYPLYQMLQLADGVPTTKYTNHAELENEAEGFRALYCAAEAELDMAKANLDLSGNYRDQMSMEIVDRRLGVLDLNEQIENLTVGLASAVLSVTELEIDLEARSKQLAVAKHRSGRYRALAAKCLDELERDGDGKKG